MRFLVDGKEISKSEALKLISKETFEEVLAMYHEGSADKCMIYDTPSYMTKDRILVIEF